jgi:anti-sigma-K factor RskA
MNEELDDLAAEYVLGTLPADERARVAERVERDEELRASVRRWQLRLLPLDEAVPEVTPPARLFDAIERATMGAASAGASFVGTAVVQELRTRLARWRVFAVGATAVAASLAAIVLVDRLAVQEEPTGGRYVAVINAEGEAPALLAEVDTSTGIIRVRTLAVETPAGHSLELWHVAEGHEPRSLGLLQPAVDRQTIQDVAVAGPVEGLIAVTVEPEGGSPSGAPTGPIVYSGELIAVE